MTWIPTTQRLKNVHDTTILLILKYGWMVDKEIQFVNQTVARMFLLHAILHVCVIVCVHVVSKFSACFLIVSSRLWTWTAADKLYALCRLLCARVCCLQVCCPFSESKQQTGDLDGYRQTSYAIQAIISTLESRNNNIPHRIKSVFKKTKFNIWRHLLIHFILSTI